MYKLAIIDDEPMIRKGLQTIIDWASLGISLCGESDNGMDGLALCRREEPDVAIVDIKMPGMDGLQLIEAGRKLGLRTDFIVLSGFSEFAYAQKATEFGVRCYLLKPIQSDQLLSKVLELRQEWEERSRMRLRVEASAALLVENVLQKLCEEEAALATIPESDAALFAERLALPWNRYQIALIGTEKGSWTLTERQWLQDQIESWLALQGKGAVAFVQPNLVVLTEEADAAAWLRDDLAPACAGRGLEIAVSVGPERTGLAELHGAYREASTRMKEKFLHARMGCLIVPRTFAGPRNAASLLPLEQRGNGLAKRIASGSAASLSEAIDNLEAAMLLSGWTELAMKADIAATYWAAVRKLASIDSHVSAIAPPLQQFAEMLERCHTLNAACEQLLGVLSQIMEQWGQRRKYEGFAEVLEYVSRHFGAGLTLESLAETFHYNSSYLGKLFKARTGRSFNAYLDELRIERAKQLLSGGAKVYEVAAEVGYANVNYFHAKFKKLAGESPSAYREKWRYREPAEKEDS